MTFEQYQKLSIEERLDYGISQALAVMSTADAVIVTDRDGQLWEVAPAELFADDGRPDQRASGFAEDPTPFDDDDTL